MFRSCLSTHLLKSQRHYCNEKMIVVVSITLDLSLVGTFMRSELQSLIEGFSSAPKNVDPDSDLSVARTSLIIGSHGLHPWLPIVRTDGAIAVKINYSVRG